MRSIEAFQKKAKKRKFNIDVLCTSCLETVVIRGVSTLVPCVAYEISLNGEFVRTVTSIDELQWYVKLLNPVIPQSEEIVINLIKQ